MLIDAPADRAWALLPDLEPVAALTPGPPLAAAGGGAARVAAPGPPTSGTRAPAPAVPGRASPAPAAPATAGGQQPAASLDLGRILAPVLARRALPVLAGAVLGALVTRWLTRR